MNFDIRYFRLCSFHLPVDDTSSTSAERITTLQMILSSRIDVPIRSPTNNIDGKSTVHFVVVHGRRVFRNLTIVSTWKCAADTLTVWLYAARFFSCPYDAEDLYRLVLCTLHLRPIVAAVYCDDAYYNTRYFCSRFLCSSPVLDVSVSRAPCSKAVSEIDLKISSSKNPFGRCTRAYQAPLYLPTVQCNDKTCVDDKRTM